MSRTYKNLILLFISSMSFIISTKSIAADGAGTNREQNDFWQKVAIAMVSASLSFLSAYALAEINRRRQPRKQLSYDTAIKQGLVAVESNVKHKVKVLYEGREIEDLYHVMCAIENTGNMVIKNQYIRFEFSEETDIVDFFFEPKPESEMGIEEVQDTQLGKHERRYKIGQIERGHKIALQFVVNSTNMQLKLHPFNEVGDVEFVPRSVSKSYDEKDKITRFLTLYLMYILVPEVFYIIPISFISSMAAGAVRLALLMLMFPLLKPFARAIADLLSKLSSARNVESQVKISDIAESAHIGDIYINASSSDK